MKTFVVALCDGGDLLAWTFRDRTVFTILHSPYGDDRGFMWHVMSQSHVAKEFFISEIDHVHDWIRQNHPTTKIKREEVWLRQWGIAKENISDCQKNNNEMPLL